MNINDLTVGQVKELAGMVGKPECDEYRPAKNGDMVIVVLQRGWVVVGRYDQSGSTGRLTDAKVIRVWGTSKGLGELAEKGPLSSTKLDPCPPVTFHTREAVFFMEVNRDAWGK